MSTKKQNFSKKNTQKNIQIRIIYNFFFVEKSCEKRNQKKKLQKKSAN